MISFEQFLSFFPEIELPITLSEDSHFDFSQHNKPLPAVAIDTYLATEADDDLTEYVACFKVPQTKGFHAIVWWKAGLLEYEYQLATFDESGNPIDKRAIASTKASGNALVRSVVTIETDWLINIVEGMEFIIDGRSSFNPEKNKVYNLEMTADGDIIVAV